MGSALQGTGLGRLADAVLERLRETIDRVVRELQTSRALGGRWIRDIQLPDGQSVHVPHGLDKPALFLLSPARTSTSATTGRIRDVTGLLVQARMADARRVFCLKAEGWGETISVDAWVM